MPGLPLNTVPVVTESSGQTNGQVWKPRKPKELTCPSGQKVWVQRPGPEFTLRAQRITRSYTKLIKEKTGKAPNLAAAKDIADMSDEELAAVLVVGRELVCAMMVSPKLVLNPRSGHDEIGPEDIGDDFWFLFNYAMEGFYGLKIPVGDTEVEVSDLQSFRGESGVSGDSVDGPHIPSDPEQPSGDQGLARSA